MQLSAVSWQSNSINVAGLALSPAKERTQTMNTLYADILAAVIDNGRLSTDWDADELDVEIDAECRERGMGVDQTAEAIEYAQAHATH